MIPAVERATRLRFRQRPVVLRRSRAQVRDYVIHKFDDDLPPAELAGAQAAYRLFGLIPDSLDLRRTMVDLLTEQVAGYFDPDSNALYIPTDIDPSQARLVISHELVHALQHQYLNLDSLVELKRQNDRRTAAQSILEGQATLAQILVLMPEQRIESLPNFWDLRTALGVQQEGMKVFGSAPLWLRESIIFPYLGGAEFVRWFDREYPGKQPYGALMPISTEQILHPARYAAGDRPDRLAFESPSPDTVRYEDGLGEFEIRLLLEQYLGDDSTAALLAAGLKRVTGRGVLSEHDVTEALREIRRHLLEADVSFEVTQGFVERVRERAVAAIALKTVSPGQQVVKLVRDEIARMLGATDQDLARKAGAPHAAPLQFASVGPTVILLVGLQGSGKTTTAAKLARRLKLEQKAPGLVAADPHRPGAAEQLRQLGEQIGVPVFGMRDAGSGMGVVELVRDALRAAEKARCRPVIVGTG